MKPTNRIKLGKTETDQAILLADCNDETGLTEGFGGREGGLRRYGGFIVMRVTSEDAHKLPGLSLDEQIRILRSYFGPLDRDGSMEVKDELGVNVIHHYPDDRPLAINPHKASHRIKEYPAPHDR